MRSVAAMGYDFDGYRLRVSFKRVSCWGYDSFYPTLSLSSLLLSLSLPPSLSLHSAFSCPLPCHLAPSDMGYRLRVSFKRVSCCGR